MHPSRRQFIQGGLAAGALLGAGGILAACGADDDPTIGGNPGDPTTTTEALRQLTVMMPFPLFLAFIADVAGVSGGYMARHGIDLDVEFARSAPQALQQLAAGNVVAVRSSPIGVVRAVSHEDAPFVSIAMVNQQIIYVLVSSPDRPFDTIESLAGARVGMATLAGNAEDTLDLLLRSKGVDVESVQREAVGNEAAALEFVEAERVDALFATRESVATMLANDLEPHVAELEANPLLGTAIVTTRDNLESHRDELVRYLRGLRETMLAIRDPEQLDELIAAVRRDWDLPQLDDPEAAKPVIGAIADMWVAAGEENLLRHVPERWDEGVAQFERMRIATEDREATDFYTNDLYDEAFG